MIFIFRISFRKVNNNIQTTQFNKRKLTVLPLSVHRKKPADKEMNSSPPVCPSLHSFSTKQV